MKMGGDDVDVGEARSGAAMAPMAMHSAFPTRPVATVALAARRHDRMYCVHRLRDQCDL